MHDVLLSAYGAASSIPAPVNQMMASFASGFRDGVDINLGVGYVNERTIPKEAIEEALRAVLSKPQKYRQALNYGAPCGSRNLIESLRAFHLVHKVGRLDPGTLDRQAIIIGPNGATSILEGIAHVVEPGIVLTSDPMYYIYCNYLERKGFEVVTVPEDENGIDVEALKHRVKLLGGRRDAIRFIYGVTINNPTCTLLSNSRRACVVEFAAQLSRQLGRKIPVVFDKAYELLVHDPTVQPLESGLLYDELGTVYEVGTLSKIFAPALRIGYLMGRDGPFLQALVQRTSDAGFSAPLVTQEMASYLLDHHVAEQLKRVNAGYREKAERVRAAMDNSLGELIRHRCGGRAGFYFYLSLDAIQTSEGSPFFRFLARTTGEVDVDGPASCRCARVVYIPGAYCVHPKGPLAEVGKCQLRISYGYEEIGHIIQAVAYMKEAADYARARATQPAPP